MRLPPPSRRALAVAERPSPPCSWPFSETKRAGDAEGWRRHPGRVRFAALFPRPAGCAGRGVLPCQVEATFPPQSGNLPRRDAYLGCLELGERPGAELILDLGRRGRCGRADYGVADIVVDEVLPSDRGGRDHRAVDGRGDHRLLHRNTEPLGLGDPAARLEAELRRVEIDLPAQLVRVLDLVTLEVVDHHERRARRAGGRRAAGGDGRWWNRLRRWG